MNNIKCAAAAILCLTLGGWSQTAPATPDFARDIQPILRERCYGCHGPAQQMQGLRLDLRRFAMPNRVGANRASIVPGNSGASPVFLKVTGKAGLQMPPDSPLSAEQIDTIKRWIDAGADWPDEFSGDAPKAEAATTTPLMRAALNEDAASVRRLLERGADPNARNDAKATALMYAIDDAEKTRLLLEHGADANARSDDGQTPLLIAAARPGAAPVVKLLLDHGADPSLQTPGGRTPLVTAALAADADVMKLLLERGASKKPLPLAQSVRSGCEACVDLLIATAERTDFADALASSVITANVPRIRMLLDRGASPGANALSALALSPVNFPTDVVEKLARSAEMDARTRMGGTILDLARLQGDTPFVHALSSAGARASSNSAPPALTPAPATSIRAAVERSLPLLDRADVSFIKKAGCVSCHNNSLAPLTRAAARKSAIGVNEQVASSQVRAIVNVLAANRERALQGLGVPGGLDTAGYILLGLSAEKYAPTEVTDAWARYLKNQQQLDGHWRIQAQRPPIESSDIEATAAAMRSLQFYAPKSKRAEYRKAVQLGARWLEAAQPKTTEDRVFLVLGLHWAGGSRQVLQRVAKELLSDQRADGGWAQLSTLSSDAYATGQALVALRESGVLNMNAPAYQRGVKFLTNSQLADGSWFVQTRTLPVQPYFDSDFPHGPNQFISTAATNWAVMAIAPAAK